MLYILLTIIAIGVLLASEAGQAFLGLLIKLAIIGGLIFLGFWIVVIVIVFFTSDTGKSFAGGTFLLIGGIFILAGLYNGGNYLVRTARDKGKRTEAWKYIKNLPFKVIKYWWEKSKVTFIFALPLILLILAALVMSLF